MDATPLTKKAPPAAAGGALPSSSAAQQAVAPSSPPSPADTAPARAVAGRVKTPTSGGGEDDDEQVERFYALLENIRAMRGMLGATATVAAAAVGTKKRAREAEPPWRPAFRMEDFEVEEVQSDAPCCDGTKRKKAEGSCGASRLPAAARRETTGEEVEEEAEGEVVEARGPRREQPKARRAGVLAVGRLGSST